jgi:hypothetical protein
MRRSLSIVLLSLSALALSGCNALSRGPTHVSNVAPSGLPWGEELIRRALVLGTFEQAYDRTLQGRDGAPKDALLRALFRGQSAYYAGRYEDAASAFAEAEQLTEQRYTKSASRGVLSVITNDHALRYVPPRTERLFMRYYAMMSRVQTGDIDGAAVEARRLSTLLEQWAGDVDPSERATHAALRDVAGAVFEAAGEWNDASVAYRNSALLRGVSRAAVDSIEVTRPLGDSATVLLVMESGFVAHYVSQQIAIPMESERSSRRSRGSFASDIETIGLASARNPFNDTAAATTAPSISRPSRGGGVQGMPTRAPGRIPAPRQDRVAVAVQKDSSDRDSVETSSRMSAWLAALDALPDGGVFADASPAETTRSDTPAAVPLTVAADWTPRRVPRTRFLGNGQHGGHWLQIEWPSLVRSRLPDASALFSLHGIARVRRDSSDTGAWQHAVSVNAQHTNSANLSDAVAADARRLRGARLARLTARTITRVAAVEAVRDKHGEAAGMIAGWLASSLEQADTRAWHLLPGRLVLQRIRVPAGSVEPSLMVGAEANALKQSMPSIDLNAGSVHVFSTRVWRDPAGAQAGMSAVANGVESSRP